MTDREDGDGEDRLKEVTVTVSRDEADVSLALLLGISPRGVIERKGTADTVEYVFYLSAETEIPDLAGMDVRSRLIAKVDWEEQARRHFHPVEVGPLRVIAPWMPRRDERDLFIEPGAAFGTGGHESTRLALEMLVGALADETVDSILDVGCGTGILALSALRLGVSRAWACDIDDAAVRAARKNAAINNLEGRLNAFKLDVTELDLDEFPLVLANINAPTIILRAKALARLTAPRGQLIVSGIYKEQTERVLCGLRENFEEMSRAREGSWCALRLARGGD
ncbi:MAG: 50S ribosomal protein L11 methyltransferase [Bacillota bacterium]